MGKVVENQLSDNWAAYKIDHSNFSFKNYNIRTLGDTLKIKVILAFVIIDWKISKI